MIAIETLVWVFLFLLGCGAIGGLLFYLVTYLEREFPGYPLFFKAARILLVVMAVLVLVFLILDLMGHPIVVWRRPVVGMIRGVLSVALRGLN